MKKRIVDNENWYECEICGKIISQDDYLEYGRKCRHCAQR
jgi:DNA-directed RNA polymerase subunit RPC12/RpoP